MRGVVIKTTGNIYKVRHDDGQIYDCIIKGAFRIKGIKTTNPATVGDQVEFECRNREDNCLIYKILPRNNYIVRKSTKLSKISHIIAANIDQAILVVTLTKPRTSTGFVDRYLTTTEAYHIPAKIIFNKTDIYGKKELELLNSMIKTYQQANYETLGISAKTGKNIIKVKEWLCGKISLISGHSGVGKSTIINKLEPGLDLKTDEISTVHQKGKHITTFTEMHKLSFGGFIIDTPGIKEFGLRDFVREEVAERFPEFRRIMHNCKFSNCTHVHEPGCAVKKAVESGEISSSRYNNYLRILNDDYFDENEWDLR